MAKFAKLFELDGGEQVLVCLTKCEGEFGVKASTDFPTHRFDAEYFVKTQEEATLIFEGWNLEKAIEYRKKCWAMY